MGFCDKLFILKLQQQKTNYLKNICTCGFYLKLQKCSSYQYILTPEVFDIALADQNFK